MANDDTINELREALRQSPDNVPLRSHLGSLMLRNGLGEEAEALFRDGLELAPASEQLKLGLARAFYQVGKDSAALVIVENMVKRPGAPAGSHLLMARLFVRAGNPARAAHAYARAISLDPNITDDQLAEQLASFMPAEPDAIDEEPEADDDEMLRDVDELGRVRIAREEAPGDHSVELERPTINFRDVGGMDGVKDEVRMKIIHPLTHAEMYKAYGKSVGGGILLYGPPGCGKTYLARATAGEVNARFLAIGIHDVLDMWIGSSEHRLHALFTQARENTPCVMFFDEVDALGASRTDMRQSAGKQLINQFLSELDGVKDSNEGVLILAATNAPWHLDSAFRRPGRFDRIIFVPPPDAPARGSILRVLLRGKPVADIDHEQIAKRTEDFSGADLKALVDTAIETKLREAMKSGTPQPLTTKDLIAAAKTLRPTTREWFATARNYALYANQGGAYDEILKHLKLT